MPPSLLKPYWVDEQLPKNEAYSYGDSDARLIAIEVDGQAVSLITPHYVPDFELSFARLTDDCLILAGEMIADEEDEEDWNEEGYGTLLVARRCPDRESTFWTLIAHTIYPETLRFLDLPCPPGHYETSLGSVETPPPPTGGTDG